LEVEREAASWWTGSRPRSPVITKGLPMSTLSPVTLIGNAAAVVSRVYGAVTRRAKLAGCSRQTLYDHARLVERRLQPPPASDESIPTTPADPVSPPATHIDPADRRRFAVEACASGISTRQVEHLLGVVLGDDAPDHATIARWVADAAVKAKAVLEVVDHASAPLVRTLAADEIFFGGARL